MQRGGCKGKCPPRPRVGWRPGPNVESACAAAASRLAGAMRHQGVGIMNKTNRAIVNTARPWARLIVVALTALLCLGTALHARAQAADADPPDRVARLSDVSGQVWLFAPETNEWLTVDRNRPL